MPLVRNWSLGSSLRSGSITLKPAFNKNFVELLLDLVKMPWKLGGVGDDEKDLEVSLGREVMVEGMSESEELSAMCYNWLVLFLMLLSVFSFFYQPTN